MAKVVELGNQSRSRIVFMPYTVYIVHEAIRCICRRCTEYCEIVLGEYEREIFRGRMQCWVFEVGEVLGFGDQGAEKVMKTR